MTDDDDPAVADADGDAIATTVNPLGIRDMPVMQPPTMPEPAWPGRGTTADPETLRAANWWAQHLIAAWGKDAQFYSLAYMVKAVVDDEAFSFRGWRNIFDVMSEFAAITGGTHPDRTLH